MLKNPDCTRAAEILREQAKTLELSFTLPGSSPLDWLGNTGEQAHHRELLELAARLEGAVVFTPGTTKLGDMTRAAIENTLSYCGGSKPLAATALGVSMKTVYNRLNHYMMSDMLEPEK